MVPSDENARQCVGDMSRFLSTLARAWSHKETGPKPVLPVSATAKASPSGANATADAVRAVLRAVKALCFRTSNSATASQSPAQANTLPSGENATPRMFSFIWPASQQASLPLVKSHTRTAMPPPVARHRPLGEKAVEWIAA